MFTSFSMPLPAIPTSDSGDYCITFDLKFLPYVLGALWVLTEKDLYETDGVNSALLASNLITQIIGGSECAVPLPVGLIFNYATANVPSGCLDCDGATYLKTDYPELWAQLPATYGVDSTHFRVPDMRGRGAIGKGTGVGLTARTLDTALGEETHLLTNAEGSPHVHNIGMRNGSVGTGTVPARSSTGAQDSTHTTTAATGTGTAHNNMQPSRVLGFCIVAR